MNAISLLSRPSHGMAHIGNRAPALSPSMFASLSAERDETRGGHRMPMAISDAFVADILKPYRKHATYLRSAAITQFSEEALEDNASEMSLVTGTGRFSIPESCYIE
jgi:hypothetical protein